MSSALWCVLKGRAAAPPGIECIIGVSTSRKPSLTIESRIDWTIFERSANTLRDDSLTIRST